MQGALGGSFGDYIYRVVVYVNEVWHCADKLCRCTCWKVLVGGECYDLPGGGSVGSRQSNDDVGVSNVAGDEIIFTTKKSAQHYRAVSFKRYDAPATALAEVFGNSGKSRLSLITCSGSWDEVKQRYSERYVVFADFTHEEHL